MATGRTGPQSGSQQYELDRFVEKITGLEEFEKITQPILDTLRQDYGNRLANLLRQQKLLEYIKLDQGASLVTKGVGDEMKALKEWGAPTEVDSNKCPGPKGKPITEDMRWAATEWLSERKAELAAEEARLNQRKVAISADIAKANGEMAAKWTKLTGLTKRRSDLNKIVAEQVSTIDALKKQLESAAESDKESIRAEIKSAEEVLTALTSSASSLDAAIATALQNWRQARSRVWQLSTGGYPESAEMEDCLKGPSPNPQDRVEGLAEVDTKLAVIKVFKDFIAANTELLIVQRACEEPASTPPSQPASGE